MLGFRVSVVLMEPYYEGTALQDFKAYVLTVPIPIYTSSKGSFSHVPVNDGAQQRKQLRASPA